MPGVFRNWTRSGAHLSHCRLCLAQGPVYCSSTPASIQIVSPEYPASGSHKGLNPGLRHCRSFLYCRATPTPCVLAFGEVLDHILEGLTPEVISLIAIKVLKCLECVLLDTGVWSTNQWSR